LLALGFDDVGRGNLKRAGGDASLENSAPVDLLMLKPIHNVLPVKRFMSL
jgi:hypothetical protein